MRLQFPSFYCKQKIPWWRFKGFFLSHRSRLHEHLDYCTEWLNEASGLILQVGRNGSLLTDRLGMWHHPRGLMGVQVHAGAECPVQTSSVRQIAFWPWSILNHQSEGEFKKVTQYQWKTFSYCSSFLLRGSTSSGLGLQDTVKVCDVW